MKTTLNFRSPHLVRSLFAREEKNLLFLGESLGVQVVARDNFIRLSGPDDAVERAGRLLRELGGIVESGHTLTGPEYRRIIKTYAADKNYSAREVLKDIPEIPFVYLTREDVLRHRLVQKIVTAYERAGK